MLLDKWGLVPVGSPFLAPEIRAHGLMGIVHGSEDFPDGAQIVTSELERIEQDGDVLYAHTASGSIYQLGEVAPEYEAKFPNAVERLLAAQERRNGK